MEYSIRNGIAQSMKIMMFLVIFFVTYSSICLSQGIKVVKVEETYSGADAFHAPKGKDGMPCGLVKLKSTIPDLCFDGQIVGAVDNKINEYYIFMERGTTHLVVSRPNVLPVVIYFPDYGIESIVSKATYSVQVKDVKLNPKTNTVSIDVKPRFASIFVDDIPIATKNSYDGHYQILLPKGSHVCRFEAEGYSPYVQGINTGKENIVLSVELESQLSDLDISCQTSSASIYINDSLMGKESWKGKLPSGSYKIDIKKEGYNSYSQNVTLAKNETRSIIIPELSRKKGKLMVETTPIEFCHASVDGFKIDKFPIDIEVGDHLLLLHTYGCDTIRSNIKVDVEKDNHFTYNFSTKNMYYEKAYQGEIEIMMALAGNKLLSAKNDNDLQEGKFWLSLVLSKIEFININFLSKFHFDDYDKYMDFRKCIGTISYSGYKNYKVLFHLFTHIEDYASAMSIIDRCGGIEKEFDGTFCDQIGDACMKIGRKADALSWYKKCVERDTWDYVKEQARKAIEKIEKERK